MKESESTGIDGAHGVAWEVVQGIVRELARLGLWDYLRYVVEVIGGAAVGGGMVAEGGGYRVKAATAACPLPAFSFPAGEQPPPPLLLMLLMHMLFPKAAAAGLSRTAAAAAARPLPPTPHPPLA